MQVFMVLKLALCPYTHIGCVPSKCGRAVLDSVVTHQDTDHLLALAKKGFAFLNKIKHLGNSEAYCANGSLDSFLCRSGIVYNEGGPCKNMLGCLKSV